MLFLRSLLFWIGMTVSTLIITPFIPFLYPIPYSIRYRYAHQWTRFNLWWLEVTCRLKYRVEGTENIPDTPCIVMAKHQSAWETMALQKMFPPQVWIMKREIFWIPFFGWAIAAMEPIAIDRSSGRKAVAQIVEQGIKKLQEGRWIVVFPEGTRVPPGKKGRYGQGGAIMATESGFPAIPVAHNAGEFWKRNDFIKRPGTIDVVIGKPIESKGKEPSALNKEVEDWIEEQMHEISITPYTGELHKRKK